MTDEQKMRNAFRAAYEREFDTCPRGYIVETGEYTNDHAAAAWWAWKTANAMYAAPTELTQRMFIAGIRAAFAPGDDHWLDAAYKAILAAKGEQQCTN